VKAVVLRVTDTDARIVSAAPAPLSTSQAAYIARLMHGPMSDACKVRMAAELAVGSVAERVGEKR
jgi:hypothetical protein